MPRKEFTKITVPTFDVHAGVNPHGAVERTNVLHRKSFQSIMLKYEVRDTRLLVVSKSGHPGVYLIDLWNTQVTTDYPFQEPWFIPDPLTLDDDLVFKFIDQAVAWAAFSVGNMHPL